MTFHAKRHDDPATIGHNSSAADPLAPRPEDVEVEAESYRQASAPREDIALVRRHLEEMAAFVGNGGAQFYVLRWELVQHAADDAALSDPAFRCLLVIADFVNAEGFLAWPKYETIGKRLGASADAVRKLVAALVNRGYVVRTDSKKRGLRYSVKSRSHFLGGRGSAYTFGKVGFTSFDHLVAARCRRSQDELAEGEEDFAHRQNDAEPDAQAGSTVPRFEHDPDAQADSKSVNRTPTPVQTRESAVQAGQGKPSSFEPHQLLEPHQLKRATSSKRPEVSKTTSSEIDLPENREGQGAVEQRKENDNLSVEQAESNNRVVPEAAGQLITTAPNYIAPAPGALVPLAPMGELALGDSAAVEGVALPVAIAEAIRASRHKVAAACLVEAVQAAIKRGVPATVIEADMRKAAVAAADEAGASGRSLTPAGLLRKAVAYVERSRFETPPWQTTAAPSTADKRALLADDGQKPRRYAAGKAKWIDGLKRHVEVVLLNDWLSAADELTGQEIARVIDAERILGQLKADTDAPALVAREAVRRVHDYDGGAVPVDQAVVERLAAKHPKVPRDFIAEHVANCYSVPARVGVDPVRYDGTPWLAELEKRTEEALPKVVELSVAERRSLLVLMSEPWDCPWRQAIRQAIADTATDHLKAAISEVDLNEPFVDLRPAFNAAVVAARSEALEHLARERTDINHGNTRDEHRLWTLEQEEGRIRSAVVKAPAATSLHAIALKSKAEHVAAVAAEKARWDTSTWKR